MRCILSFVALMGVTVWGSVSSAQILSFEAQLARMAGTDLRFWDVSNASCDLGSIAVAAYEPPFVTLLTYGASGQGVPLDALVTEFGFVTNQDDGTVLIAEVVVTGEADALLFYELALCTVDGCAPSPRTYDSIVVIAETCPYAETE